MEEDELEVTHIPRICPKCGGNMVEGRIIVPVERSKSQSMSPMSPGFMMDIPTVIEDVTSIPYWEEKTGEKTGLIFKRDEIIQLKMGGYRCRLCYYIEIYAIPK